MIMTGLMTILARAPETHKETSLESGAFHRLFVAKLKNSQGIAEAAAENVQEATQVVREKATGGKGSN